MENEEIDLDVLESLNTALLIGNPDGTSYDLKGPNPDFDGTVCDNLIRETESLDNMSHLCNPSFDYETSHYAMHELAVSNGLNRLYEQWNIGVQKLVRFIRIRRLRQVKSKRVVPTRKTRKRIKRKYK